MKEYEILSDEVIPENKWFIIRLDGSSFSKFTKRFEKPFDQEFNRIMNETTHYLFNIGYNPVLAFHQSDEISLLFHPEDGIYNRRILKICSELAGLCAGKFSLEVNHPIGFDGRIIAVSDEENVLKYLKDRQSDAIRNAVQGHAYWYLRQQRKLSGRKADKKLFGKFPEQILKYMEDKYNYDWTKFPIWHFLGTLVVYQDYQKLGFNPITKEEVWAERRKLINLTVPILQFKDFQQLNEFITKQA